MFIVSSAIRWEGATSEKPNKGKHNKNIVNMEIAELVSYSNKERVQSDINNLLSHEAFADILKAVAKKSAAQVGLKLVTIEGALLVSDDIDLYEIPVGVVLKPDYPLSAPYCRVVTPEGYKIVGNSPIVQANGVFCSAAVGTLSQWSSAADSERSLISLFSDILLSCSENIPITPVGESTSASGQPVEVPQPAVIAAVNEKEIQPSVNTTDQQSSPIISTPGLPSDGRVSPPSQLEQQPDLQLPAEVCQPHTEEQINADLQPSPTTSQLEQQLQELNLPTEVPQSAVSENPQNTSPSISQLEQQLKELNIATDDLVVSEETVPNTAEVPAADIWRSDSTPEDLVTKTSQLEQQLRELDVQTDDPIVEVESNSQKASPNSQAFSVSDTTANLTDTSQLELQLRDLDIVTDVPNLSAENINSTSQNPPASHEQFEMPQAFLPVETVADVDPDADDLQMRVNETPAMIPISTPSTQQSEHVPESIAVRGMPSAFLPNDGAGQATSVGSAIKNGQPAALPIGAPTTQQPDVHVPSAVVEGNTQIGGLPSAFLPNNGAEVSASVGANKTDPPVAHPIAPTTQQPDVHVPNAIVEGNNQMGNNQMPSTFLPNNTPNRAVDVSSPVSAQSLAANSPNAASGSSRAFLPVDPMAATNISSPLGTFSSFGESGVGSPIASGPLHVLFSPEGSSNNRCNATINNNIAEQKQKPKGFTDLYPRQADGGDDENNEKERQELLALLRPRVAKDLADAKQTSATRLNDWENGRKEIVREETAMFKEKYEAFVKAVPGVDEAVRDAQLAEERAQNFIRDNGETYMDLIQPDCPLGQQCLEYWALDNAFEDALRALDQGLRSGSINPSQFHRALLDIARKQFEARSIQNKITKIYCSQANFSEKYVSCFNTKQSPSYKGKKNVRSYYLQMRYLQGGSFCCFVCFLSNHNLKQ